MKKLLLGSFVMCGLLLTGCGTAQKTSETTDAKGDYPITVSNYSRADESSKWKKFDVTFDEAPQRVVANVRPAAELLLHLGLADQIAGVGGDFGAADESVAAEYKKLKILGDSYIGQEKTLSVDPDLVFGRGGLFVDEEWGVGSVPTLSQMKINTYVQASSVTGATFDSVYEDIAELGKIFHVEKQAASFTSQLKKREKTLKAKVAAADAGTRTFAYLHNSEPSDTSVYAAGDESLFNDTMEMVGLKNAFLDESSEISLETLIETDPDVLIVPDWSTYETGITGEEMVKGILNNEKLSSLKAVKNKQVYAMDYNHMFGYGYQSLTGVEKLADEMYGD